MEHNMVNISNWYQVNQVGYFTNVANDLNSRLSRTNLVSSLGELELGASK